MQDSTPRSLTPEWLLEILPVPSGCVVSMLFPAGGLGGDLSWSVERTIIVPSLEFKKGALYIPQTINSKAGEKICPHSIHRLHLSELSDHIATIIILMEEKTHYLHCQKVYWVLLTILEIHSFSK